MTKRNKPLVFIVEDNNAYRMLISRILQKNGFMVMVYDHGKKAAEMLKYIRPDLIVSDIEMPGMDGFEFQDHVKRNFPELKIPFIYLSSTTCEKSIEKATTLGATDMLDKPVSVQKLRDTIYEVLASKA